MHMYMTEKTWETHKQRICLLTLMRFFLTMHYSRKLCLLLISCFTLTCLIKPAFLVML